MKPITVLSVLLVGLALLLGALLFAESARAYPVAQVALDPAEQQPNPASPHVIPGKIEAEDYDTGGEGVAYHDLTPGNYGGQYRSEDVDIEATTDADGGYSVGWTEQGEWLSYSVYVTKTADYDIQVRVASAVGRTISDTLPSIGVITWTVPLTKTLHVEFDGQDVSGPLTFLTTGGWQSWHSVFARGVPLPAGEHRLRLVMDSGSFNVNWVWVTPALPEDPVPALIDQMTLTEKIGQLGGSDWMDTADNVRLGIPRLAVADGPHGIREGKATVLPHGDRDGCHLGSGTSRAGRRGPGPGGPGEGSQPGARALPGYHPRPQKRPESRERWRRAVPDWQDWRGHRPGHPIDPSDRNPQAFRREESPN